MRTRHGRQRAAIILEFVLVLPLILALLVFSVDIGRMVMARMSLHDVVSTAARAGARQGYSGTDSPGGALCAKSFTGNPTYDSFCNSVNAGSLMGGVQATRMWITSPTPGGGYCDRATAGALFVTAHATADMRFITPGLRELLTGELDAEAVLEETAVARCENAR